MVRLAFYGLAWAACNLVIGAAMAGLGFLLMFYTTLGPFACVYVGARLGNWCGFDIFLTSMFMMAGLWLFGSVRVPLYRHVWRWWRQGHRVVHGAAAFRDDIWRQYRAAVESEVRP